MAKNYIYVVYNVLSMKKIILLFAVLLMLLLPFTAGKPERRSLDITSLTIKFDKTDAEFTVNYDLDELPKLYILLLGSKSLEPKIKSIFSDFDYEITRMDQDKAILTVKNISRLEKGFYLHDSRKFGENIKKIIIYTPDSTRPGEYYNLDSTPNKFYRS